MIIALQNASPHSLLYLLTATAVETATIPNAAGATPDLQTDALTATALSPNGMPLLELIRTALGVGASAAIARWLLLGGGSPAAAANNPVAEPNGFSLARRARCEITPVGAGANLFWAVTASVNGAGLAQLDIQVDGTIAGEDDLALLRLYWDAPTYTGLDRGSI